MENIQSTQDYTLFTYLSGNRPIDKGHVKRLIKSIEKNNRLNLHPIIVNGKNEIIDGQHRHAAAKQLGIELFFIKSESVDDEHLIDCNVNQKLFEVENYIDFFSVKEKNPDYIQLKQFLQSTQLKPKALLCLILGTVNGSLLNFLKTGKFRFPVSQDHLTVIDFYLDFMAYVKDKCIRPNSMFTNHSFAKAMRWLFQTSGFSSELFFKKLDLKWFDLKPQRTAEEWYELLISIYNFKNHSRIEGEFGKAS